MLILTPLNSLCNMKTVLSPIWCGFIRDKMSIKEAVECSCSNKILHWKSHSGPEPLEEVIKITDNYRSIYRRGIVQKNGKKLKDECSNVRKACYVCENIGHIARSTLQDQNISHSIPHMVFGIVTDETILITRLNSGIYKNHIWHRIWHIVLFNILAGIRTSLYLIVPPIVHGKVALLVPPIVHGKVSIIKNVY